MSKKKKAEPVGKARVELRVDADLFERAKSLADAADISLNQLFNGVMRWAVARAVVGEPYFTEQGEDDGVQELKTRNQAGCVWLKRTSEEFRVYGHHVGYDLITFLDFTERRVVRDDVQPRPESASESTAKPGRTTRK